MEKIANLGLTSLKNNDTIYMENVITLLSNPAVLATLKVLSPEVAIGVDLVLAISKGLIQEQNPLLSIIDKKLTLILKELTDNPSLYRKHELEIRALQLLEIAAEWNKIK